MKPAPFEYVLPSTLEEALSTLHSRAEGAKLLAGGQSLVPVMNFRLAQPTLLIDLNRLAELDTIQVFASGELHVGAMVRQSRLEQDVGVAAAQPLLSMALPHVAHPQIRNRGTLGGSLAHADPAAELPVVAVALRARFELKSAAGTRTVGAAEFYRDLFDTIIDDDEILTGVIFPAIEPRTGFSFQEFARRHGDYALSGVAAAITVDQSGVCRNASVVILNAGPTPVHAIACERMIVGNRYSDELAAEAANAIDQDIAPSGDVHASAAYKRHLAQVLVRRSLTLAFQRAVNNDRQ